MATICIQVELELKVPMLMIDRKSDTFKAQIRTEEIMLLCNINLIALVAHRH